MFVVAVMITMCGGSTIQTTKNSESMKRVRIFPLRTIVVDVFLMKLRRKCMPNTRNIFAVFSPENRLVVTCSFALLCETIKRKRSYLSILDKLFWFSRNHKSWLYCLVNAVAQFVGWKITQFLFWCCVERVEQWLGMWMIEWCLTQQKDTRILNRKTSKIAKFPNSMGNKNRSIKITSSLTSCIVKKRFHNEFISFYIFCVVITHKIGTFRRNQSLLLPEICKTMKAK